MRNSHAGVRVVDHWILMDDYTSGQKQKLLAVMTRHETSLLLHMIVTNA